MKQYSKYVFFFIFISAIFFIGWYPEQRDFYQIIFGFTIAFVSYAILVSKKDRFAINFQSLFILGVCARLVLIPLFPNLSDDVYRFFWDGLLSHNGINPYSILPSEVLEKMNEGQWLTIYSDMNSQEYYTIYPPIAQCFFYLAAFVKSIEGFSIVLKCIFLAFELLSFYFLTRLCDKFTLRRENVFYYFLNPLVIIEGVGNLHFETIMLSLFAGSLYFLSKSNIWAFVSTFVLAVATKLVPLIFGPILFLKFVKGKSSFYSICFGSILIALIFYPVYSGLQISNFANSLDLYFRKFEFNASVYYILREIGYWIKGYNTIQIIGPVLGVISLGSILFLSFAPKVLSLKQLLNVCIAIVSIYLLTATTVHPWYLMTLILLSVFNPYKYIYVWSFLVLLSYATYADPNFKENMFLIFLEYMLVGSLMIKPLRDAFIHLKLAIVDPKQ